MAVPRGFSNSEDAARGIVMKAASPTKNSEPVNLGTGMKFHPQLGY